MMSGGCLISQSAHKTCELDLPQIHFKGLYHYFICRKRLFESVNHFIHLNLSFTLLAAFIVFVLGIELGRSTTVSFQ